MERTISENSACLRAQVGGPSSMAALNSACIVAAARTEQLVGMIRQVLINGAVGQSSKRSLLVVRSQDDHSDYRICYNSVTFACLYLISATLCLEKDTGVDFFPVVHLPAPKHRILNCNIQNVLHRMLPVNF